MHRVVAERIGGIERIAFGWQDDDRVVARIMVGRRYVYRSFVVPPDDDTELVEALVAWVHAESPKTS